MQYEATTRLKETCVTYPNREDCGLPKSYLCTSCTLQGEVKPEVAPMKSLVQSASHEVAHKARTGNPEPR